MTETGNQPTASNTDQAPEGKSSRWRRLAATASLASLGAAALAGIGALGATTAAYADSNGCQLVGNNATCHFHYTGTGSSFTVPSTATSNATVTVTGVGQNGQGLGSASGGSGGKESATLTVTPGTTLYSDVGVEGGNYNGYGGGSFVAVTHSITNSGTPVFAAGGGGDAGEDQQSPSPYESGGSGGSGGGSPYGSQGQGQGQSTFIINGAGGGGMSGGRSGNAYCSGDECYNSSAGQGGTNGVANATGVTATATSNQSGVGGGAYIDMTATFTLPTGTGHSWNSGDKINPGDSYFTAQGYHLFMQGDGNLIEADPWGNIIWSTGTGGHTNGYAQFTGGQLVVFDSTGSTALYKSDANSTGSQLVLVSNSSSPSDGSLQIWGSAGSAFPNWQTLPLGVMLSGADELPGETIATPGHQMVAQWDGNVVYYHTYYNGSSFTETPLWASNTSGHTNVSWGFNGHIVVSSGNNPLYTSPNSTAGAYLGLQGDGNIVIYNGNGSANWATGTHD